MVGPFVVSVSLVLFVVAIGLAWGVERVENSESESEQTESDGCIERHEWEDDEDALLYFVLEWRSNVTYDNEKEEPVVRLRRHIPQSCAHCNKERHVWRKRFDVPLKELDEKYGN